MVVLNVKQTLENDGAEANFAALSKAQPKSRVATSVHLSTNRSMPSLYPDPGFEYYYKACKKGDSEAKAVTVD